MSEHDVRDGQLPRGAGSSREVPAILAASVIVCRDDPFEILLLRRNTNSSFVPDAWVFPGGALDDADRAIAAAGAADPFQAALKVCAIRETLEECGLWLGDDVGDVAVLRARLVEDVSALAEQTDSITAALDRLTLTSHWITPLGVPKRFDTWFYLAKAPAAGVATVDQRETVEALWITPDTALQRNRDGELSMVFPTIKNIEALAGYTSFAALVADRTGAEIPAIQPLLVRDGDRKKLVLPDRT